MTDEIHHFLPAIMKIFAYNIYFLSNLFLILTFILFICLFFFIHTELRLADRKF